MMRCRFAAPCGHANQTHGISSPHLVASEHYMLGLQHPHLPANIRRVHALHQSIITSIIIVHRHSRAAKAKGVPDETLLENTR